MWGRSYLTVGKEVCVGQWYNSPPNGAVPSPEENSLPLGTA